MGLFLALCETIDKSEQLKVSIIATFSSFLLMLLSMLFGTDILGFFGISISAFQIAGGILLFYSGLNMLNSGGIKKDEPPMQHSQVISIAVVPISIPLTTGAGTMSTVTLFSDFAKTSHEQWLLFMAICTMTMVIFLVFRFATTLMKTLGETGMSVFIKALD